MTANNCDRCGNNKGPDCWEDKCKPAEHRPSYAEIELERDKAYEWLGAWQKWSLKLLRSWGRYQELTHPGDHGARDEIASEVTRLRESEAKAWGLVEQRDAIDRRMQSLRRSEFDFRPLCLDSFGVLRNLEESAIEITRAALAARKAGQ